jgi:hemolysin activation/secretion protein
VPTLAHAQAYRRIAPREPAPAGMPAVTAPAAQPPLPASDAVVVQDLKGLAFLPGMAAFKSAGLPTGTAGISAAGLPLLGLAGFTEQISPYLGRPASFATLNAIARAVSDWYRRHDHPFVFVNIPPQNVSAGVIQIVVTEYRIETVKVSGNKWFSSSLIEKESGFAAGQALDLDSVRSSLAWLNSNPFRSVNAEFAPGHAPGTTDITLATQDRLPLNVYSGFDNQGVPSLGRAEWNLGGSWGNLFGLDQILAYQFTRSVSGRYNAHSLSWTIPLPWRDKLLVFGSYARERPDLGADGAYFNETGHSGQASLRYVHTLPTLVLGERTRLSEDVQIGYDFKTTDNNLEFGGQQVFAARADIHQFPLIYDATLTDPLGQTELQNQLVLSPGDLSGTNNKTAFETLVPGSSARYAYNRIGLTRTTFLPRGFSWTARILGQVSSRNLMYSEQLGLGGQGSVRGYYTDTALGSKGVLVSNELRTPAFSLGRIANLHLPVPDAEQFGVFWDYGHVSQVTPIENAVNEADLSSVGLDLRADIGRYANLVLDVGWRLRAAPDSRARGGFVDVSLTMRY